MRMTDNMRFNTAVTNLFNTQSQYYSLMEKMMSQKKVNRASDDPVAAMKIIDIRQGIAANEQYLKSIVDTDAWISMTESKLSSASDLLVSAQEIAVAQSTATASASSRKIAAQSVQSLIDEMASLANAQFGNRYIFSGSRNDVPPFSSTLSTAAIEQAQKAADNAFDGTVTSSGTYTGTVNNTYAVKITGGGALAAATYQFSADGGQTWNTVGNIINTVGAAPITAATLIKDITGYTGYLNTDYILMGGTDTDGVTVPADTRLALSATTTVGDLLTRIQDVFGNVTASITSEGKLMINTPGAYANALAVDINVKDAGGAADNTLRFDTTGSLTNMPMPLAGVPVDLGDGVKLAFDDLAGTKTFRENDIFYVNAIAGGYYQGNSDRLSMTVNRGMNITYNVTGAEAFTAEGGVDVFKTLNDLRDALDANNAPAIAGQLENIRSAQNQIVLNQSLCGAKANHIEMAKSNLSSFAEKLTSLLSEKQDADLADYATKLSRTEIALQASYSVAAKISDITILNFLK